MSESRKPFSTINFPSQRVSSSEWEVIKSNPTYEVSRTGIVRNKYTKEIKHQSLCRDRYKVSLNGYSYYVHRLVAEAFIEHPDCFDVVNHIDENPLNNNVENLQWCSQQYNTTCGTVQQRRAEKVSKGKIIQYDCLGRKIKEYPSLNYLFKHGLTAIWHRIIRNSSNRLYNSTYWLRENEDINKFIHLNVKQTKLKLVI